MERQEGLFYKLNLKIVYTISLLFHILSFQIYAQQKNITNPKQKSQEIKTVIESDPIEEEEKEKSSVTIDVSHEIVNDYVWRGQSFTGDFLSRRDNLPYSSFAQAYTYVPIARVTHTSGFYFELEANLAMKGRADRDSDQRLQAFPGGGQIDSNRFINRYVSENYLPDAQGNSLFYDRTNNVYSDKCNLSLPENPFTNRCAVDPTKIRPYAEKNGMARTDGLFTTFAYEMDAGKFGTFTAGTWWYFKKDRSSKYTWNEFFIWWELPWFKELLNPTLQTFTQTSYDVGGGYGNQYTSFSLSHTFFSDKPVSLEWTSSAGYVYVNNNVSKKSGVNDITTNFKFLWKDYFLSFNHAYRPDIDLYDNNRNFFTTSDTTGLVTNLSERDGRTADPSKLYGASNDFVYTAINQANIGEAVKVFARDQYQSQMIPRHLFWIGIGVNQTF